MKNSLERKLAAYAAGATAAAIGAVSAHGAIVATSANIPFNVASTNANVDFNNDGIVDYAIVHGGSGGASSTSDYCDLKQGATANLGATNRFVIDSTSNNRIMALAAGTEIGTSSLLDNNLSGQSNTGESSVSLYDERKTSRYGAGPTGNFHPDDLSGNPEYVGVRFKIGGAGTDYYGWIAVDFTNHDDVTGAVTGFAYEDTGASILAGATGAVPEPSGLAGLALGAAAMLRRKSR
jgi:PEP-CTERM motif